MNEILNLDTWVELFPQVFAAKIIIYFSYSNNIFRILSSGTLISQFIYLFSFRFGYETNILELFERVINNSKA